MSLCALFSRKYLDIYNSNHKALVSLEKEINDDVRKPSHH